MLNYDALDRVNRAAAFYENGATINQLVDHFCISKEIIRRWLRESQVVMRGTVPKKRFRMPPSKRELAWRKFCFERAGQ